MREVLGGAVVLLSAMALFVLKAEYLDWGQRVARLLVRWAAWGLPEPDRSTSREEWEAELDAVREDTERSCTGLTYAGWLAARHGWRSPLRGTAAAAGRLRRWVRIRRLQLPGVDFIWTGNDGTVMVAQVKTSISIGLMADDWQDGDVVP